MNAFDIHTVVPFPINYDRYNTLLSYLDFDGSGYSFLDRKSI